MFPSKYFPGWPGDLRDSFLLACSDRPVLATDPEQAAVERVVVREVALLHLARDGHQEEAAAACQHLRLSGHLQQVDNKYDSELVDTDCGIYSTWEWPAHHHPHPWQHKMRKLWQFSRDIIIYSVYFDLC